MSSWGGDGARVLAGRCPLRWTAGGWEGREDGREGWRDGGRKRVWRGVRRCVGGGNLVLHEVSFCLAEKEACCGPEGGSLP